LEIVVIGGPLKQGEKILIIDDDRALQESCRLVFAGKNYSIESAFEGLSGLRRYEELKPDLVLVDLCMPGLGGLEVLEKLKSQDPDCVVIVITAYGTIASAVEAMKLGAYDFLPKPFTPDHLRFIVRRGLERRRFIEETARLRREKQLMRENFVSMVSHELRAPLAAVQQKLSLVTGGYAGEVSGEARDIIKGMQERIKGLISLIGDWLDLSRIDAGETIGVREEVDLGAVVTEVLAILRPLADGKKVSLEVASVGRVPPVMGNREILMMLFSNLVDNAIKYNREGGKVHIRLEDEDGNIKAAVGDTGVGISGDDLPLIFEQFYRAKGGDRAQGSGLGLSISRKIAELHGGRIEVESEMGKGTVFTVRLPASGDQRTLSKGKGKST
jgi:two-component system sensor histidine kinase/response regulator